MMSENKAYFVKVHDYSTEDSFDKLYKILVLDKDGNELFMAKGIKQVELNFEYTWKHYNNEITKLEAKIETYEKMIEKLQKRIEDRIRQESEVNQ